MFTEDKIKLRYLLLPAIQLDLLLSIAFTVFGLMLNINKYLIYNVYLFPLISALFCSVFSFSYTYNNNMKNVHIRLLVIIMAYIFSIVSIVFMIGSFFIYDYLIGSFSLKSSICFIIAERLYPKMYKTNTILIFNYRRKNPIAT